MVFVLLLLAGIPMAVASDQPPEFLSDDAQVACRAILPQCFTRVDWWSLCDSDSSIVEAHPWPVQLQIRLRLWAMTLKDRLKLALLQLRDDKDLLSHAPFSGRQLVATTNGDRDA